MHTWSTSESVSCELQVNHNKQIIGLLLAKVHNHYRRLISSVIVACNCVYLRNNENLFHRNVYIWTNW